jgi:hypothetical protein
MTFSYDLTTDVGKIRLLIPDRTTATAFFTDEELTAMLSLEGDVRRAAALALETMASDEAYVQKVIKVLDLQTNGAATAKELRERAAALRAQAAEAELASDPGFDVAEMVVDDFSYRQRLANEIERGN